jgi:peroxiredoxin
LYWRAIFRIKLAGDAITSVLEEARAFAKAAPEAPERAVGLLAQAGFSARRPQDAAAAYREILERWPTYPQAAIYRGLLRQIEAVGSKLPLSFTDVVKGGKLDLAQMEGSVVVLDFFSTTLGASTSRLTTLKMLRRELGEKGLVVLGVCMDDDRETAADKIKEWATQNKVEWPIEWSGQRVRPNWIEGWGVLAVPGMFILDRRGLIRHTSAPSNLKGELEKLLKEKS